MLKSRSRRHRPSMQAKLSKLVPVALLFIFLLSVSGAQAAEPYDLTVYSPYYEPGIAVKITVFGYANQSFSLRITEEDGDIVAGRDDRTNVTGVYEFTAWAPAQEGTYNATVVFATGVTITKGFLIQSKVTDQDIAQIYQTLFGIRDRLTVAIEDIKSMQTYVIVVSVSALALSIAMMLYTRKYASRMETEFERVMKAMGESEMGKALKKLMAENVALKKASEPPQKP